MGVLGRYDALVDDAVAFRAACDRPLPTVVRINPLKATRRQVTAALDEAGIEWTPIDWHEDLLEIETDAPGVTWPYFLGWMHSQEEVSALPVEILAPSAGSFVWDACAAPGSKTSQLTTVMQDEGLIVANDDSLGRLSALRSNAERLGITNIAVTHQDARNYSLSAFDFEAFDHALVDAPCSGEGTVRKNPGALADWSESFLHDIQQVQIGILRRAIQATRPGGTVVYSTCTFAPEENEAVLDRVLRMEDCQIVPFDCPLDSSSGIREWQGESFDESVQAARRIWPHQNDTGGFFCAQLRVNS